MAATPEQKHRRRWLTLGVLSLSLLIIGLDNTILNVALPTVQRTFDASGSQLQWIVDSYVLVFAGLLLTMGSLGDRLGRKRALIAGLLIFGAASLFAAQAGGAGQLIAARAVMGIGGALIMPATLSIVVDVFPREERGKAIGIWAAVAGAGIGLGPLLGGLLLEHFWWGAVFLINVPVVVIALGSGAFLVPESRDPRPRRADIPGAVLSMGAVTALVYGIIEAPSAGWLAGSTLAAAGASVVLIGLFVWRELTTAHPMLDLRFFRNPRFSAGTAAIGIVFFALFGAIFLLTQYLQFVQGYSALEAGIRTAPIAVGVAAGAGRSNRMVRRFGPRRVIAAAEVGLALVLLSIMLWTPDTTYWIVGGTVLLMAFFTGNVMAPATNSVMNAVPESHAGVGSAMNDVTRQVGGALGVATIGSVLNTVYGNTMAPAVAALPTPAAEAARDSLGPALHVAGQLPGPVGTALAEAARHAYVEGLGIALLVAAAAALAGALVTRRFLPRDEAREPEATAVPALDAGRA